MKTKQSQYGELKLIADIYINASGTYAEDIDGKKLDIKKDSDGHPYVEDGGIYYVDSLVAFGFLPKQRISEVGLYIEHIDGNPSNCKSDNLQWTKADPSKPTTGNTVYFAGMIVRKDGTLIVGKEKETAMIKDRNIDTDLDLVWVYETPTAMTFETDPYGPELWNIEKWMDKAGFVMGDESSFKEPVILHVDGDVTNFNVGNLEWCEKDDQRYIDYIKIRKERQIKLIEDYNAGKKLPPHWPHR